MNNDKVIEIIRAISCKIDEEKDFLTKLDNEIGDGDHGVNLARGFKAIEQNIDPNKDKDIGTTLKNIGMGLLGTVGGTSGPLYGTAFMKAGAYMKDRNEIDTNDFIECLKVAYEGIMMRGKSTVNEKTMLDAMVPAYDAMLKANNEGLNPKEVFKKGVEAAWNGVEYTKTIIATKGRASYIGERSIGHQDPGATSFSYILETIYNNI